MTTDRDGRLLAAGDRVRCNADFMHGKTFIKKAPYEGTVLQAPAPGYESGGREAIKIQWDGGLITIGDAGRTLEKLV